MSKTKFIECDRFLSTGERLDLLEDFRRQAGDDVNIVLLGPGMRVAEDYQEQINKAREHLRAAIEILEELEDT